MARRLRDGAPLRGVADDSPAMAAAARDLRGTGETVLIPGDCRIRLAGADEVWMQGMGFRGPGLRDMGPTYGRHGGTILLEDTARPPFVVSDGWGLDGLAFYWPAQQPMAAPIAYPPLIATHAHDTVDGGHFLNNQVMNAFDVMDFTAAGIGSGHMHIEGNMMFALRYYLHVRQLQGEIWIANNQFSETAFLAVAGSVSGPMLAYAADHAEAVRVEGDGTTATNSTVSADAVLMMHNYVFLTRYGVHVVGGTVALTANGNDFDGVAQPMAAESGGAFAFTTVTGGSWQVAHFGHPERTACALDVSGPPTGGTAAPNNNITVTGTAILGTAGPAICFSDIGNAALSLTGVVMTNIGTAPGTASRAIDFSAATNGILTVTGGQMLNYPKNGPTDAIRVNARAFSITGAVLSGWSTAVAVTGGAGTIAGIVTIGTTGPHAITGPVTQAGNNLDKR